MLLSVISDVASQSVPFVSTENRLCRWIIIQESLIGRNISPTESKNCKNERKAECEHWKNHRQSLEIAKTNGIPIVNARKIADSAKESQKRTERSKPTAGMGSARTIECQHVPKDCLAYARHALLLPHKEIAWALSGSRFRTSLLLVRAWTTRMLLWHFWNKIPLCFRHLLCTCPGEMGKHPA